MKVMPCLAQVHVACLSCQPTAVSVGGLIGGMPCCCRSRYAFAAMDRQTSVVASPRLALAAAATWQGVLVHEIGHCIDFFAFPQ